MAFAAVFFAVIVFRHRQHAAVFHEDDGGERRRAAVKSGADERDAAADPESEAVEFGDRAKEFNGQVFIDGELRSLDGIEIQNAHRVAVFGGVESFLNGRVVLRHAIRGHTRGKGLILRARPDAERAQRKDKRQQDDPKSFFHTVYLHAASKGFHTYTSRLYPTLHGM